eukprot:s395_g12.t1
MGEEVPPWRLWRQQKQDQNAKDAWAAGRGYEEALLGSSFCSDEALTTGVKKALQELLSSRATVEDPRQSASPYGAVGGQPSDSSGLPGKGYYVAQAHADGAARSSAASSNQARPGLGRDLVADRGPRLKAFPKSKPSKSNRKVFEEKWGYKKPRGGKCREYFAKESAFCGLAMVITTIVAFRCYFHGIDFQDMAFTEYLKYDKNGGPEPMLFKIQREGMPRAMIVRKIEECKAALSYMEDFVKSPGKGRILVAFSACYQVVADSVNHLHCFLQCEESEPGRLLLP